MKNYFLALFLLLGLFHGSIADDKTTNLSLPKKPKEIKDSISIIMSMPESKDKIILVTRLALNYRFSNFDSAFLYYSMAEKWLSN